MSKKNIIIVLSLKGADGARPFLDYNAESIERYAAKIDCELKIIRQWEGFVSKSWRYDKFIKLDVLHHFCKEYDRMIYLDDTVYITPSAENLFKLVLNIL